jgi:ATP-binding cassette, subfamily B, multidrug efflux pump
MIQRAAASQKRLNEFLHTPSDLKDNNTDTETITQGNIEFNNVSFTYNHTGITALKNITLKIAQGQRIAIIGKTGSGKSSFSQLLLRMYDATQGTIHIDGKPIKNYNLQQLRKSISYVPQDVFLFSDTIANNIKFGNETADINAVKKIAQKAVVAADIEGFEQQYNTMVGERGVTLSGGQKQRVSIARALLKPAPIVILDDCLSAVDSKTEKEILENLNTLLHGKTCIIISHRIFSLLQFDKILVLNDGQIAEQGTHEDLLKLNGIYTELYNLQQNRDQAI